MLNNLNHPKGVSRQEIFHYLVAKYNLVANTAKRSFHVALSNEVKRGDLMKIKIAGSTYVYGLKNNDNTRHKRKIKTTAARPGVKELYPNPDIVASLQHLPKPKHAITSDAGKQLSENGSVKQPLNKGIRKLRSSKQTTTVSTHATGDIATSETTGVQPEPNRNHGSEHHASSLSHLTISHRESIFVKISCDDQSCHIDALDLTPDGRIVLVDTTNKRLKIFDHKGTCLSFYTFHELEIGPTALSVLNNEEVIVSFHRQHSVETNLHIMATEANKLAVKHTIPVFGHRINGVASYKDNIFISGEVLGSNEIRFVRLIDRDGQTIWNTNINRKSLQDYRTGSPFSMVFPPLEYFLPDCLSSFPSYNNRPALIMTDTANKRLLIVDGDTGDIVKDFAGFDKDYIKGTTVGRGIVYVSFFNRQEIVAMDDNLSSNKTLIRLNWHPIRIKYDELYNQLLVSKAAFGEANNYIESFKVEP